MRIQYHCLGLVLLGVVSLGAAPVPATLPAPDYASPRAVYISLQKLLAAYDLDAYVKCAVPVATEQERDDLRASTYLNVISLALVDRFGEEKAARYAGLARSKDALMAQAVGAVEKVNGDEGQLLFAGGAEGGLPRPPMNFRKVDGEWRMVVSMPKYETLQRKINQSHVAFARTVLQQLRDGKIRDVADFEKQQSLHTAAVNVLRRVEPVFTPATLDPAGLRITAVAVPAKESTDGAFHVDLILMNTGGKDLNLLLGTANPGSTSRYLENGAIEAVDREGIPTHIPMIRGFAYSGPPPVPWVIALHPGESFTMRPQMPFGAPRPEPVAAPGVGRGNAAHPRPNVTVPPYFLPPGTYTFTATFMSNQVHEKRQEGDLFAHGVDVNKAVASIPIWTGTVVSEPVKIDVPAPK